jgi:hypothetical protein
MSNSSSHGSLDTELTGLSDPELSSPEEFNRFIFNSIGLFQQQFM